MPRAAVGLLLCYASGAASSLASVEKDAASSSPWRVMEIRTEHLKEPVGLDARSPRFNWLLESSERAQLQTAYQIQVSTTLEGLRSGRADKWDSGKVVSDNSVEIVYQGSELHSGEKAYWRVRAWDSRDRPSDYSSPTTFEMGLLRTDDWGGKWIAANKGVSAPLFRRDIKLSTSVRRARAYISGLGHYEFSINGQRADERVLDPASTYYNNDLPFKLNTRVLYTTYDVTSLLQAGDNAIGVMLGNGWYSEEADKDRFRDPYGDRPRFILQINVELMDGRTFHVVSDASWKTSSGPVTYNDLFHGETYDARLEQTGWNRPGFDASAWEYAELIEAPSGALSAQSIPPIRVMETLPATRTLSPREPEAQFFDGAYVYDFGQHFSGWVRIAVSGPRGSKLVLKYGSRIDPEDHTLDNRSSATPVADARQTDTYILKGEGIEIWEPRFTLHGFRYVEARGLDVSIQKIEGRFVRSAVEPTGTFTSSNQLLNRIHRNIQWTLMSSMQGILQDAADRGEREGWLGDPGFVAEDYLNNYDMLLFLEKWLNDIQDSQKASGAIPSMAPLHIRRWDALYDVWPSWQSTYPLLVWNLYQYYGDQQVLRSHYANLKQLVSFLSAAAKNQLIPGEPLGDHMEPQDDGFSRLASRHTPSGLTANAYYYYNVLTVARIADVLGHSRESKHYRALAQDIKDAFNLKFLDSTSHRYATGSQTSHALPLYLGMVPEAQVPGVMQALLDDIIKRDYHVSTGIIGSNALVHALPRYDAASVMYRLATQTTYPSLGHQVMRGATTVCETYECGPWISQNMKMFASLDKFFYNSLAGITIVSPGYRRVRIQPQAVGDLESVSASQRTVRGTISVDWKRSNNSFALNATIPPGIEADIAIPKLDMTSGQVTEGVTPVWKSNAYVPGTPGLTGGESNSDSIVLHAGSGNYQFTLTSTQTN